MQATLKALITPLAYLEKIRLLRTPEEIEAICNSLTEALFNKTDKPKTRTNKLTPYNKVVNTIPNEELVEGENAYIQTKADGSLWKRHLHFKFSGLADTKWHGERGINTKTVVLDRLENRRKVEVAKYLETTIKLLQSDDPHELAVGLVAASGRRPVEILVRGSFTQATELPEYLKPGYFVNFRGQAKKRDYDVPEDERVEYRIGVLVPAEFFLAAFGRFREMPETKELLDYLKTETGKGTDPEAINDAIDSRRGNSLRRVVKREFDNFLPARHGETELNNKALRAVYVRLITDRDCPKNIADLLWASRAVGHFIDESKPDDSNLRHLVTTLGYSDYYADSEVIYLTIPTKSTEKTSQLRVLNSDVEIVKQLQNELDLPNQQSVIHYLIKKASRVENLERQLMEAQTEIAKLKEEKTQVQEIQPQSQQQPVTSAPQPQDLDLQSLIRLLITEELQKVLPQPQQQPVTEAPLAQAQSKVKPEQPEKDWQSVPSEELRNSKARGASDERIYRAFKAVCDYNDQAPSNDQRWFIGNVTLRDLSGCNGMLVKDWMERHHQSVDDHNLKYGLGQYHNKRHRNIDVVDVVKW